MSGTVSPAATLDTLHRDGGKVIAIASSMLSVAITSVSLRLTAKYLNKNSFGLDDLFIGVALLCFLATESLILRAVSVGMHAIDVQDQGYVEFAEFTTFYSMIYWSVAAFATLSILFLYRRIFYMHRFFSIASYILICLTVMWWISGTICEALAFRPLQAFWDTHLNGRYYIDYDKFWLANMISELILETAILALPLREVTRLQLENRRKALVVIMFCMGIFVLITGGVRINYVWTTSDMTPGVIWLSVHSCTAIVSACLPTYGPLLARVPWLQNSVYHRHSGHTPRDCNNTIGGTSNRKPSNPINGTGNLQHVSLKRDRNSLDDLFLDEAKIAIKNDSGNYSGDLHLCHHVVVEVRERGASESTEKTSIDGEHDQDHNQASNNEKGEISSTGYPDSLTNVAPATESADNESWEAAAALDRRREELQRQTRRARLEYELELPSRLGEQDEKMSNG